MEQIQALVKSTYCSADLIYLIHGLIPEIPAARSISSKRATQEPMLLVN
jgi:hypothetical protein